MSLCGQLQNIQCSVVGGERTIYHSVDFLLRRESCAVTRGELHPRGIVRYIMIVGKTFNIKLKAYSFPHFTYLMYYLTVIYYLTVLINVKFVHLFQCFLKM